MIFTGVETVIAALTIAAKKAGSGTVYEEHKKTTVIVIKEGTTLHSSGCLMKNHCPGATGAWKQIG